MPCTGKDGKACKCPGFQPKRDDGASTNPKCKNCKHRQQLHSARTVNAILADRLAQSDIADRLKVKHVTDADARRETSTGFRKKEAGSSSSTSGKTSRNSNAQSSEDAVIVGSIQVLVCGLDEKKQLRDTQCPAGQTVEYLRDKKLMVVKAPADGKPLQFNRTWRPIRGEQWIRDMLPKPGVLQYVDAKYGTSDRHWVLVGKAKQKLYAMASRPGAGEDFEDSAKGTGGSNRNYKDYIVRIATTHKIPATVFEKGWENAIAQVQAGEDMPSESEAEELPSKPKPKSTKSKGKAKAQPRRARSLSEIEAESSDDSDSDVGSTQELINVKIKQEPDTPAEKRRSSRLSQAPHSIEDRKPSHAGSHRPLFDHDSDHDSDILEIPGFEAEAEYLQGESKSTRKRIASPSLGDISDSEGKKRRRSASYGSQYGMMEMDTISENEDLLSPILGPVTSSFSFDPAAGNAQSSIDGSFLSASTSFFGSSLPFSSSATRGPTSVISSGSTSGGSSRTTSGSGPASSSIASSSGTAATSASASSAGTVFGGGAAGTSVAARSSMPSTKYNPYA
ncbi:hypothetical protein C8R44DRAFT_883574 [Mycena epipterygia]|nr:hypothetical protein C8R44DRAFT_883574 [Mycena epipterygia]